MKDYALLALSLSIILAIVGVPPLRALVASTMAIVAFYCFMNASLTWLARTCPVEPCLPNILAAAMFAGIGVLVLFV